MRGDLGSGSLDVPPSVYALLRGKRAGGERSLSLQPRQHGTRHRPDSREVGPQAPAYLAPLVFKDGIILDRKHARRMAPVFEDPSLGQQSLQKSGGVPGNSRGEHEVLVALYGGHGIELHGFQSPDSRSTWPDVATAAGR